MTVPAVDSDTWIRRFRPAADATGRLVCFPHAGGSASFYYWLSAALSPDVDVLAVQYPGRQDRRAEPPIEDIHTLADQISVALGSTGTGPAVFFGHSMGAVVAFEVARRMDRKTGMPPVALVVSGRRAPSQYRHESVHRRDDDGVIAELKRLSGTDSSILGDEELVRMFLPAIRSDYHALETYTYLPGPPLSCPITVLTGDQDPQVTLAEANAWSGHTTGRFDLHIFEGGHFYFNSHRARMVERLAEILRPHS
jgi:surfactin synthase thioesterase subunit